MKILKKANQKNFNVDRAHYTRKTLNDLIDGGYIKNLGDYFPTYDEETYIVFASSAKEVKVILDEFGYYRPVVITEDGTQIYIEL